jgi:RNA polymerase sigma-70 factor (ECF subfamily)
MSEPSQQSRDDVDWSQLVQVEGGKLLGLALRVCGDRADAEDLVQETFLQAYRNWEKFEGRSEFSSWLYTIASRICFRKRRRRAGQPERVESIESLLPATENTIPDLESLDPLDGMLREEIRDEVDRALAELPFQFRIPCLLKETAGFSLAEVAEILGLKEATVKTRVHHARLILRKALSEKVPRKKANSDAHSRQICLDLLEAKQAALDHRLPFPLEDSELCARCYSVIITLGMTQEILDELSQGELPESLMRRILHSTKAGHN